MISILGNCKWSQLYLYWILWPGQVGREKQVLGLKRVWLWCWNDSTNRTVTFEQNSIWNCLDLFMTDCTLFDHESGMTEYPDSSVHICLPNSFHCGFCLLIVNYWTDKRDWKTIIIVNIYNSAGHWNMLKTGMDIEIFCSS